MQATLERAAPRIRWKKTSSRILPAAFSCWFRRVRRSGQTIHSRSDRCAVQQDRRGSPLQGSLDHHLRAWLEAQRHGRRHQCRGVSRAVEPDGGDGIAPSPGILAGARGGRDLRRLARAFGRRRRARGGPDFLDPDGDRAPRRRGLCARGAGARQGIAGRDRRDLVARPSRSPQHATGDDRAQFWRSDRLHRTLAILSRSGGADRHGGLRPIARRRRAAGCEGPRQGDRRLRRPRRRRQPGDRGDAATSLFAKLSRTVGGRAASPPIRTQCLSR